MVPPLNGIRVLTVEQYGAGPFGTQHLADLGAEVIKIENRQTGGDYARELGPYFVADAKSGEGSLFFQSINRNKKSLCLDLSIEGGRQVFRRLVTKADAVANNLRGDVPERLGLTYDQLKSVNPAIVCAHCTAYGRKGPRRTWPGFDYLMQAETGYFNLTGEPDTLPARMGLSIVDFMAGTYLAFGVVTGVLAASRTGVGRDIDVSLYDTALFNLNYLAVWALNSEYEPKRVARSAHPSLVPCQLYRTGDGWIYIMCNKEKFWPPLCEILGIPEVATDPRFSSFGARAGARDDLTLLLDAALARNSTDHWLERLRGIVPVAPVRTPKEALADPEMIGNDRIETLKMGTVSEIRTLKSPIRAGGVTESSPCPALGENTRALLHDAGYSDDEIDQMEANGYI